MKTSRVSIRSACSATVPASVFSIGITAAPTDPPARRSNTSADRAHGTTVHRGSIRSAASWLNDPSSPWIATFISFSLHSFLNSARYLENARERNCFLHLVVQFLLHYQRIHAVGI